jgi:excisionase family DNA binding protein
VSAHSPRPRLLLDAPTLDQALTPLHQFEAAAAALTLEQVAEAIGQLERIKALLWLRLSTGGGDAATAEDRLLTAEDAAQRLGISMDTLYRKAKRFSFTVRIGHQVRFSFNGISQYIKTRQGRP